MDYYVYIIHSKSKQKYYTGMTDDINRRLKQHNQKLSNTRTTKNITDFELIFCQIARDRKEARTMEKYLKSGAGREIREQIVQSNILGS